MSRFCIKNPQLDQAEGKNVVEMLYIGGFISCDKNDILVNYL